MLHALFVLGRERERNLLLHPFVRVFVMFVLLSTLFNFAPVTWLFFRGKIHAEKKVKERKEKERKERERNNKSPLSADVSAKLCLVKGRREMV